MSENDYRGGEFSAGYVPELGRYDLPSADIHLLADLDRVVLSPDDMLVLRAQQPMSRAQFQRIHDALDKIPPLKGRVVVLSQLDIGVVSKEDTPFERPAITTGYPNDAEEQAAIDRVLGTSVSDDYYQRGLRAPRWLRRLRARCGRG